MWMDWLSLFVRWFHVIAGVAWIGASFYFIWLDNNLRTPPDWKKEKGIKGDLWAVHGGGFYEIDKYTYGPETIPEPLHWFKWEAYTTWLSGFALLVLVYYFGASAYLIDPSVAALSESEAILLGLATVFGGLALYEAGCRSPLAKSPVAFAIALTLMICVVTYFTTQWFSGRGAYIHVGALIGTIMAANVFLNIIPAQKKMVAAVARKGDIDPAWGAGAKLRSVHNNYFTLPLLFIMISNHYPMTYQHELNWLVLILIMAISAWIRHFFNLKHTGTVKPGILISGALAMLALAVWVSWPQTVPPVQSAAQQSDASEMTQVPEKNLSNDEVMQLITTHCQGCHSRTPTDNVFKVAPVGVVLDSWEDVERQAPQIIRRTSITKDMPFMNKTNMTEDERAALHQWYQNWASQNN